MRYRSVLTVFVLSGALALAACSNAGDPQGDPNVASCEHNNDTCTEYTGLALDRVGPADCSGTWRSGLACARVGAVGKCLVDPPVEEVYYYDTGWTATQGENDCAARFYPWQPL